MCSSLMSLRVSGVSYLRDEFVSLLLSNVKAGFETIPYLAKP
ncbi:hypothetical protein PF010_g14212 [Phytophthora fragariae]|uniref:Uncharacterized protein n=1 Tax=Phytophthora fragariae TaxID=53985 RepID=A0A6A3FB81_9STRA|nr:hypothetical protein PF009_g7185 [Phytophthora fragariae]KAE9102147.1 hypothetical protein PF010_g14212 [Phytophthora fragariae]KAE9122223.1 hypothetical protein PF007_g7527 [Phytophthora fragariae]KAE9153900.1 hypothetical protein PF006_g2030 [Phytophthora fragariae]KAE9292217.1 hypothetical protein PF001_g18810 [Phytophthora fragariae]